MPHHWKTLVGLILLGGWGCGDRGGDFAPLPATARQPLQEERTDERVALGRALFWDPILSGNRDVACATCHHPDHGYADGRVRSAGTGWVGLGPQRRPGSAEAFPELTRNSPTVLNTGFNGYTDAQLGLPDPASAPMFWDSRRSGLAAQAAEPLLAAAEMRGAAYPQSQAHTIVVARLQELPEYVRLFESAWGAGPITRERVMASIAIFERTLVMTGTSLDRYLAGDASALTDVQKRGLEAFLDSGCAACHRGPMLSDYQLHDLGLGTAGDPGDGSGRFRTASLRGVLLTAPYFHDGRAATLEEVIDTYRDLQRGEGRGGPARDPALRNLDVGRRDTNDIIAFLQAASDGTFDRTVPKRVPSGGPVGGLIGK